MGKREAVVLFCFVLEIKHNKLIIFYCPNLDASDTPGGQLLIITLG